MAVISEDGTPASYEMNQLVAALGGHEVLGGDGRSGIDVVQLTRAGLPTAVLDHLVRSGRLLPCDVARIVPRRSLVRRRRLGRLSPWESDHLVRMVRVVLAAELTFGPEKARFWLHRPTAILGGEQPLERVDTDAGACSVTELLARIDYGLSA